MASEATLAKRSEKQQAKDARRAQKQAMQAEIARANDQRERGQVAAQFITSLARDIYAQNVALLTEETPEKLYAAYRVVAHKAMDAAIAFVRASNEYDDRGRVAPNAPPILAPTDANGAPVAE